MNKKKIAGAIATAAAIAFVTAPIATTSYAAHQVKCYGVNACKGQSACKTATNTCKGKNSCKGQGFLMESAAQCKKMNGSLKMMKS